MNTMTEPFQLVGVDPPQKNRIYAFGYRTNYRCYLNMEFEDALHRYLEEEQDERPRHEIINSMREIEFDQSFGSYALWDLEVKEIHRAADYAPSVRVHRMDGHVADSEDDEPVETEAEQRVQ